MEKYKVSVCIPAYNQPHLLKRCILSVLEQTYTNFEIIVTDDSNHTELEKVAASFSDSRIIYIKNQQQLGSPKNWNEAISRATGELIKLLHHDDSFSNKNALATFVAAYENSPDTAFWFSQCYNNYGNHKKLFGTSYSFYKKIIKHPEKLLLVNDIGAPSVTLFTRELAQSILFDINSFWLVDVIFYIKVIKENKNIGYIRHPLVNITTGSEFQITNKTIGLRKVQETVYAFELFDFFKMENFRLIHKLYFLELFKRYTPYQNNEFDVYWSKLPLHVKGFLKFSKTFKNLPIPYKIYAVVRRILVKYF